VVAVTVTLILVLHSLSAWQGIKWLAARNPGRHRSSLTRTSDCDLPG